MKHLILLSALLFAPLSFAGQCITFSDAQLKLAEEIQTTDDVEVDYIFDLESGTEEAQFFLDDLKFNQKDNAWLTDASFSYRGDDAPDDAQPIRGYIYGKVTCDGKASLRVSYIHD